MISPSQLPEAIDAELAMELMHDQATLSYVAACFNFGSAVSMLLTLGLTEDILRQAFENTLKASQIVLAANSIRTADAPSPEEPS